MTNKRLDILPLILGLIVATIIAVVGIMEAFYSWIIGIPLIILAIVIGRMYDRRLSDSQKHNSNKGIRVGIVGTIVSVGALLLRGSEFTAYVTPLLSIITGVAVWYVLSRSAQERTFEDSSASASS